MYCPDLEVIVQFCVVIRFWELCNRQWVSEGWRNLLHNEEYQSIFLILVSFYSHLPAYEDGTDIVFRNAGI